MPVRKLKSCVHCRRAKARCSLSNPCSRCAARRLECQYAAAPLRPQRRWPVTFRAIRPALAADGHEREQAEQVVNYQEDTRLMVEGTALALGTQPEEQNGSCSHAESMACVQIDHSTETEAALSSLQQTGSAFDMSLAFTPAPHDMLSQYGADSCSGLISPRLLSLEFSEMFPGLVTPASTSVDTPNTKLLGPQLSQRSRSLQEGSMTAKMIFSRVADYSRLMADAKSLPPFIYPPCCLGSGDECSSQSPHQCLPEPLAVCSNLCRMFHSRLPGSHDFIWKQICTHMRQMSGEFEGYDEKGKLQALQAALVYGMLCSQCTDSVPAEDSAWVVETIETFAEELFDLGTWALDVDDPASSREDWIFVESIRRIGCMLYLFDLLLQVDTQTPSKGDCDEFFELPLPCYRNLWEPVSDRDWKKRYQEYVEAKKQKGRSGLTLGNLLLTRQAAAHGIDITKAARPGFPEELAEWCERADDLSMLLWMALTVEGEGQSQIYSAGVIPGISS